MAQYMYDIAQPFLYNSLTAICNIINLSSIILPLKPDLIANNQSSILYEKNTIYNHRALQHFVGRSAE